MRAGAISRRNVASSIVNETCWTPEVRVRPVVERVADLEPLRVGERDERDVLPAATATGSSTTISRRGTFCSTIPSDWSSSAKGFAEPSMPGISAASTSTTRLSTRMPRAAGEQVLDGVHLGAALPDDRRAALAGREVGRVGRDPRGSRQVDADERDARVGRGGPDPDFDVGARVKGAALERALPLDRTLVPGHPFRPSGVRPRLAHGRAGRHRGRDTAPATTAAGSREPVRGSAGATRARGTATVPGSAGGPPRGAP